MWQRVLPLCTPNQCRIHEFQGLTSIQSSHQSQTLTSQMCTLCANRTPRSSYTNDYRSGGGLHLGLTHPRCHVSSTQQPAMFPIACGAFTCISTHLGGTQAALSRLDVPRPTDRAGALTLITQVLPASQYATPSPILTIQITYVRISV